MRIKYSGLIDAFSYELVFNYELKVGCNLISEKHQVTLVRHNDKNKQQDANRRNCLVICAVMLIIVMAYGLFWCLQASRKFPFMLGAVISLCFAFAWVSACRRAKPKDRDAHLYLLVLLLSGLAYCFMFTPFSVPDEGYHYSASYCYSNFLLGKGYQSEDPVTMRAADAQFLYDASTQLNCSEIDKEISGFKQFGVSSEVEIEVTTNHGHYVSSNLPQEKIASAFGMAIARILNLGPYWVFYIGRLFNLLQFVLFVYIGYRIIPFGKSAYITASLLPMTLHLAGSYSYDSFIISMSMLLTAVCLRAIYRSGRISVLEMFEIGVCIALLAPCKVIYTLIALLVLFIPRERFSSKKNELIVKCCYLALPLLIILIVKLNDILTTTNIASSNDSGSRGGETIELYTVGYFLNQPLQFFGIMSQTIETYGYFYLQSLVGGSLGWFQGEISSPHTLVVFLVLILFFSTFVSSGDSFNPSIRFKVTGILISAVGFFLVMITMLLNWTAASESAIQGVQGRYFLPYLVWFLVSLRTKRLSFHGDSERIVIMLMYFANAINLIRIMAIALMIA